MGGDTKIYLPAYAQLRAVEKVVGIAAGLPWHKQLIGGHNKTAWAPRVEGLSVESCEGVPEMARILLRMPNGTVFLDGSEVHHVFYYFEGSRRGERLLMPSMCRFWQVIGKRLVEFFGGRLDLCDCDDTENDLVVSPIYPIGLPDDGAAWQALQEKIAAVKPVTREELDDLREP